MNTDGARGSRAGLSKRRAEGSAAADGHNGGRGFADQADGVLVGGFFQGLGVECE